LSVKDHWTHSPKVLERYAIQHGVSIVEPRADDGAGNHVVDLSATEFRRRASRKRIRAAAAGKKCGAPLRQPKFASAPAAEFFTVRQWQGEFHELLQHL